jgi:hypothetical protein
VINHAVSTADLSTPPRSVENISTRGPLNRRSLGFARDDKGEGSAHLSSRYRRMGRSTAGYPLFSSPWVGRRTMTTRSKSWVGKENCRSLGYARDDKGKGSDHLSSRYGGMDRAAADYPRFSSPWVGRRTMTTLSKSWVGKENCRSLGYARDDKGKGSDHLSSSYGGMDRAAADYPRFSSPWVGRRPMTPPVEMTNLLSNRICHLDRSVA